MDIRETLTKKVGPLPVWGWAVLILGAYLAWSYYTKSGPFAGSGASAGSSSGGSAGGGYYSDLLSGGQPGGVGAVGAAGSGSGSNPPPDLGPQTAIATWFYQGKQYYEQILGGAPPSLSFTYGGQNYNPGILTGNAATSFISSGVAQPGPGQFAFDPSSGKTTYTGLDQSNLVVH